MRIRVTLHPHQRGAHKLLAQYGDRLVCVRYRYDEQLKKRWKMVELIVEEGSWDPPKQQASESLVFVHVALPEVEMRRQVKRAGGVWDPHRRAWELRSDRVKALGLESRIVRSAGF